MMFGARDTLPVVVEAEGSPSEVEVVVVAVAGSPGVVVVVAAVAVAVALHGRYAQLTARDGRGANTSLAALGIAEAPHVYREPGTFRR